MIHLGGTAKAHEDLKPLLKSIDEVQQHPDNYNNGDIEAIQESIVANGVYRPIFVQASTGYIIAGNHTWLACKALGATEVPVVLLDVDQYHAKRIMLADNRTAALAMPDNALLLNILNELHDADSLIGTGYRENDLEVLTHLAEIPVAGEDDFAQWPTLSFKVPPHVRRAFWEMTEDAVGDREKFELLLRLAGWDGL
jgi:ParB-like chromosome segregation protein Spo0J